MKDKTSCLIILACDSFLKYCLVIVYKLKAVPERFTSLKVLDGFIYIIVWG